MKIIHLLISSILSIGALAQKTANADTTTGKQYLPTALQEDFSIFRKTLETIYPSLYRYSDSVDISAYLDKQFELLKRPMEETEFYKIIALTCARLKDEHL